MTLSREVLPERTYLFTRRCTQRQFLMRPDAETNNAFIYCLAVAANRFGIQVQYTMPVSNHHHTGARDPEGNYPEFLELFHKLFAKCQNSLRGRWEMGNALVTLEHAGLVPTMSIPHSSTIDEQIVGLTDGSRD